MALPLRKLRYASCVTEDDLEARLSERPSEKVMNKDQNPEGTTTSMVQSDPEVIAGALVFRGTRVPVYLIADIIEQAATAIDEILDGYPSLTRETVECAEIYATAHPAPSRVADTALIRDEAARTEEGELRRVT